MRRHLLETLLKASPTSANRHKPIVNHANQTLCAMANTAMPPYSDVSNMVFKTVVISFVATMVTHPAKTVSYHLMDNAAFSLSAVIKSARDSLRSSIISGQQRGASSGVAKHVSKNKSASQEAETSNLEEQSQAENQAPQIANAAVKAIYRNPLLQAGIFSQIDLVSSSYQCNKGTIIGLGRKIPTMDAIGLVAHIKNCWTIFRTGYTFRTVGGFVSFGTLLVGTEIVNGLIPDDVRRTSTGKYVAGGLTGAFNAVVTYPINVAAESMLLQTKVHYGQVVSPTTVGFFKQAAANLSEKGLYEISIEFAMQARSQLPLRAMTSILLFSVINGMQESLGQTPLNDATSSILGR